jgi:hypothetical protein
MQTRGNRNKTATVNTYEVEFSPKWRNILGGVRFAQYLWCSEAYLHGPRTLSDCDLFGSGYAGLGSGCWD